MDNLDIFDSTKLGGPLSAFAGLTLVEKIGAWETYTRPSDRLKFQGAELNGVSYNFFAGKFYSIHVEILEKRNVEKLVKWATSTYGTEFKADTKSFGPKLNRLMVREWQGKHVDFVLKFAEDYAGGTLIYVDHAMWLALEKPRRERMSATSRSFEGSWTNLDFD